MRRDEVRDWQRLLRGNLKFRDSILDFSTPSRSSKRTPYASPEIDVSPRRPLIGFACTRDFCGHTRHATAHGDPFGWRRRGERGRSQLAEADLRARCKAEAHLFHERRPRRAVTAAVYPYWIINLAGWLLGSAVLHRSGSSRKPYAPGKCMFRRRSCGTTCRSRSRRYRDLRSPSKSGARDIPPTRCGFAPSLLCGKRVARERETRRATCLSEFPIA